MASKQASKVKFEFEKLPETAHKLIFKKLDPNSVLRLRVTNSNVKAIVDKEILLSLRINTSNMTFKTLRRLFALQVETIQFEGMRPKEGDHVPVAAKYILKHPSKVKALQFNNELSLNKDQAENEKFVYQIIKQCEDFKELSLRTLRFCGEPLTEIQNKRWKRLVERAKGLQTLRIVYLDSKEEERTRVMIHHILRSTWPILSTISLNLTCSRTTYSPWTVALRFVARHCESVKDLTLKNYFLTYPTHDVEDLSAITDEVKENLAKITKLTDLCIVSNEYSVGVKSILVDLIERQTKLSTLTVSHIDQDTLTKVVENNFESLTSLIIEDLLAKPKNPNILDMSIFSKCEGLKKISITKDFLKGAVSRSTQFKIMNLEMIPMSVQTLCLSGLSFAVDGLEQIKALSIRDFLGVELFLEDIVNIKGICSIVNNFFVNSNYLDFFSITLKRRCFRNRFPLISSAQWHKECSGLQMMFRDLGGNGVMHRFEGTNGRMYDDKFFDLEWVTPIKEYFTYTALGITEGDRLELISIYKAIEKHL